MTKRIISVLILVSVLIAVCPTPFVMAESRASDNITSCYVSLSSGSSSGELNLSYKITAGMTGTTRLGILAIFVYRTDGSLARVITGNTTNGLIQTSGAFARGTYSFTCEPGTAYYCNVTFIAENANGSDVRSYTTNTVVAPF